MSFLKRPVNSAYFCWALAAYYALVLNAPFIFKAYDFICIKETTLVASLYIIPLIFFLYVVALFLVCLLSIKYIEKPLFIVLTLLCSVLSYAYVDYGLILDDESTFIGVLEQTSFKEIRPFITPSFLLWFSLSGLLPSYIIYAVRIIRPSWIQEIGLKGLSILLYPLFFFTTLLPSAPSYAPMFQLSGLAARIPFQMIPTNFAQSVFHHYQAKVHVQLPYRKIGLDATRKTTPHEKQHQLLVIALGETARSANFELNGYNRPTNHYTAQQHPVSFQHVSSCSTTTRVSIPCIFSSMNRNTFFTMMAENQDNLLDILKRVGIHLAWVDNNGNGGCQGVCKHIQSKITEGLDEVLINDLREHMEQAQGQDTVIILHLHGSHGPNYFDKYPENFGDFKPDCRQYEFRLCDTPSLLNAYDNSLLYTDYVLNEFIKVLQSDPQHWAPALIYTSDHGESIGEHGVYGHCAPYAIAPKEQTHVPLLVWMSPEFKKEKQLSSRCLEQKAKQNNFSHDHLFHSVLGLMDVTTAVYDERLDLFKSCRF